MKYQTDPNSMIDLGRPLRFSLQRTILRDPQTIRTKVKIKYWKSLLLDICLLRDCLYKNM